MGVREQMVKPATVTVSNFAFPSSVVSHVTAVANLQGERRQPYKFSMGSVK
jgi:hypothetical protein